ncbi:MAG: hypothetical protein ACKOB3_04560, partial [Holophagaceae bacterium]
MSSEKNNNNKKAKKGASGALSFVGSVALMKELQRTAAFRAYNDLLISGESKEVKKLCDAVSVKYFGVEGDPDSIGYAEQLVKGMNSFSELYTTEAEIGKGEVKMILKKDFHCLPSKVIHVSTQAHDSSINMGILSSKGLTKRNQVTPRCLWDYGKAVETNGKKALALIAESEYAGGKMPSGKKYEDYLRFLREGMFKMLKGGDSAETVDDVDDDPAEPEEDEEPDKSTEAPHMKEDYTFPGFIAFALWGPIIPDGADPSFKAEAFWCSDHDTHSGAAGGTKKRDKSGGRDALRKKKWEEEASARRGGDGSSKGTSISSTTTSKSCGVSEEQRRLEGERHDLLFAAYMAQQHAKMRLDTLKTNLRSLERAADTWKGLLLGEEKTSDVYQYFLNGFMKANDALQVAREELKTISMARSKKRDDGAVDESSDDDDVEYLSVVKKTLSATFNKENSSSKTCANNT